MELKWKRVGYVVKHRGAYLGAGPAVVNGVEVRVPFHVYRSPAAAKRAAALVGGELHEVHQGRGHGVATPPVVLASRVATPPRRRG